MQALLGDNDWTGQQSKRRAGAPKLRASGPPLRSVISQECEGAHIAADMRAS